MSNKYHVTPNTRNVKGDSNVVACQCKAVVWGYCSQLHSSPTLNPRPLTFMHNMNKLWWLITLHSQLIDTSKWEESCVRSYYISLVGLEFPYLSYLSYISRSHRKSEACLAQIMNKNAEENLYNSCYCRLNKNLYIIKPVISIYKYFDPMKILPGWAIHLIAFVVQSQCATLIGVKIWLSCKT